MLLNRTRRQAWETLVLLAIVLLALGLRFYRLDAQSFWNDEGTSVALAQRDLATITRNAAHDIHPPLYYYLLRGWMLLFGQSAPIGAEFAARSLSALMGLLLVVGTYALASRLWNKGSALLAALFSCLSSFQVYYSQEARMYIGVALFGLLSMLALERLLRHWQEAGQAGSAWWAVLYVLSITAALYTQYYALSLLLAQNLIFLVWLAGRWHRRAAGWQWPLLRWTLLQVIILSSFAPWLWFARGSLRSWPAVSVPLSWSALLADVARVFTLGVTTPEDGRSRLWGSLLALLLVPAFIAGLSAWRRRDTSAIGTAPGSHPKDETGLGLVMVWIYLLVPIVVMYLLSLQRPMYKPKFLLLATPPFCMLQGYGLLALGDWLKRVIHQPWLALAVSGALALLIGWGPVASLGRLYFDPAYARDDYRGIVAHIQATAGPHDAILINAPTQIETVGYYYRGPLELYPLPLQRPIDTKRTQAALEEMVAKHPKIYGIFGPLMRATLIALSRPGWTATASKQRILGMATCGWSYATPLAPATTIEHPTKFELGAAIRFDGYTLLTPEPRGGDILQLTLFWEATGPVSARYKVFCHLVNGAGNIVSQRDSEPGGGLSLTTDWQPEHLITDNYGLLIPSGTPPGEYILRIGMYGLDDGLRLSVSRDGRQVGDSIDLERIMVGP